MKTTTLRSVARIVTAERHLEGGGFPVRRPFPSRTLAQVDPFLMLDHLGPVTYGPGEAVGAPDHPHRGFETVTYLLEGRMEHRDSAGNHGVLGPGSVQWMTAGAGVVHSELPEKSFLDAGGVLHGFQLWVNLPKKDKMIAPRYQDTPAALIPVVEAEGAKVKVIAGESLGVRAVIDTRTPIQFLHVKLDPGARFTQPVPHEHQAFVYALGGAGRVSERALLEGQAAVLAPDGEAVALEGGKQGLDALLISGVPINEPVARYGPFVMNTEAEIYQAIEDFRAGRLGKL